MAFRKSFRHVCMKGEHMEKKPITENTEPNMLNISLQKELIKRIKVFCAEKEITVQEFVTDAIIEKLELVYKERRRKSRL
ncbi:MAG: hypothetical protein SRB2_04678 [Desulfobacteraceae bacterium Eth-SRB2]|nr:MAG: hypothetical protein SRB2_04678 [Desulfobacteraceae bacterium Eth-SRB2]